MQTETETPSAVQPGEPQAAKAQVWRAYVGLGLEHAAYVVSELGHPERIIAAAPFALYYEDDQSTPDAAEERANALQACRRIAADPAAFTKDEHVFDYRGYGKLDSVEEMPDGPYAWHLARLEDGDSTASKMGATRIFPFCRFRIAQMLGLKPAWAGGLSAEGQPDPTLAGESLALVRRAKQLADDLELFAMDNEATSVLAYDALEVANGCVRSLADMFIHADKVECRGVTGRPTDAPRSRDMIFGLEDFDPKPCLPFACGKRIEPDGVRLFSLPQAMKRFGMPRKQLEALWLDACASAWAGALPIQAK
jgi:hypothetical protein